MLRRTGFKRKEYIRPPSPAPSRGRLVAMATITGEVVSAPKDPRYEDPHLLRMARGQPCLLQTPLCNHNPETSVACHSNSSQHGKGGARKAHDAYTVVGCYSCHSWLDAGPATHEEKAAVFAAGHWRQVKAWQAIASDPRAPAKDRASAQAALDKIADDEIRLR